MNDKEQKPGGSGRKKVLFIGICAALIVSAGAGTSVWYLSGRKEEQPQRRENAAGRELSLGADVVTVGGSTSIGMQEESFDLDYIETGLVIEEVYLSSQEEVEAGMAILKLTDESVEAARRELEEKATQADLDYREALLDGEEEKITVQQTRDTSLLNGTYAEYTYEESLKGYEEEIESLQEQIEEAQELVDEYTASIESDYYYTYYEVAEKEEELNTTFAALMQLYEDWDVEELEELYPTASSGSSGEGSGEGTGSEDAGGAEPGASDMGMGMNLQAGAGSSGAGGSGAEGGMGAGGSSGSRVSNDSTKLTVYDMLDQEVQENEAAYEEALENYETAKAAAESSLARAQTNLELLKIQLEEAQIEYEKQRVSSQSDRDAAISESGSAQETYQTEMERIEDEISVALNKKEEAEENLQEFEDVIGDGYLYTTDAGTVMMVNVREGTELTGGSMVLAYSSPDTVTVTASVDQEDIASVEIGGEAVVSVSDLGNFDGFVRSIDPVSSSSSRSTVTYSVVVELTGDVSGLSQNLSATVYLGVSTADLQPAESPAAAENAVTAESPAAEESTMPGEEPVPAEGE
ncbi:MAG TPA: HlyD family efflux transporter periplasmic adaptor subunit [Candidatus Eisenbergiella merdipullorum]|uniref:HlyD family efflux transporter periplasmic adaptor subunit n=1 Tax=Candidatus Eisenbergiella merdipullorum TaxID=2838553 RepID=A0A9D2I3V1_9FIRM|nr:HlyD family efflux transporter periplasmic adaptor subunit [Candidatus Eisenbergiella merdipullorum]